MATSVKKEEQYTLLIPDQRILDNTLIDELETQVSLQMEAGHTSLIIDLAVVENVSADLSHSLNTIYNMILKEDGILVIANANAEVEAAIMGSDELIFTPTLSEAVDYLFMEQIQRQLQQDNEDEEFED